MATVTTGRVIGLGGFIIGGLASYVAVKKMTEKNNGGPQGKFSVANELMKTKTKWNIIGKDTGKRDDRTIEKVRETSCTV